MKVRLEELKTPFILMAGGICQRCGYCEFPNSLSFHHIDRSTKRATPQKIIMSGDYDKTFAELEKCVLLCMNCHQAFHARRWTAEFVKRHGLGWTLKK